MKLMDSSMQVNQKFLNFDDDMYFMLSLDKDIFLKMKTLEAKQILKMTQVVTDAQNGW